MIIKIFPFLLFTISAGFAQPDIKYKSYLAHLTANSSFRLNEPSEAKRWIIDTPKKNRWWEWNYINKKLESSKNKFELTDSRPTKCNYSPDSRVLLSGKDNGKITMWNFTTFEKQRVIDRHKGAPHSFAFLKDDESFISGGEDRAAKLWDFDTGKPFKEFIGHSQRIYSITVSPDRQKLIANSSGSEIMIFDAATPR